LIEDYPSMLETRRAFYIQIATIAVLVTGLVFISRFVDVLALVVGAQRRVLQWGAWSGVCYPFLFALCNLLLLPGGILCVGSGFFFGLWWGFFIVLVGNGISAALAFVLSRSLLHGRIRRRFSENRLLRFLEPVVERDGWKIILLTQLHPLFPTSLINYLYGLTTVKFRTYMLWTAVGRAPGLFVYVYLGTLGQLGVNLATGKSHPRVVEYWIWGGAFFVTCALLVLVSRLAFKEIQRAKLIDSK
jgi:uncharacterized membrane protein YdjX (TVP38/TMEM64 family)